MGREQHGYTLVELMFVVAVLAILCTVAVVAYTRNIRKVRHDGETAQVVAELTTQEELYKQDHTRYVALERWPPLGDPVPSAGMPASWRVLSPRLPTVLRCQYEVTLEGATFEIHSRCP